jgi:hypothetical protein
MTEEGWGAAAISGVRLVVVAVVVMAARLVGLVGLVI